MATSLTQRGSGAKSEIGNERVRRVQGGAEGEGYTYGHKCFSQTSSREWKMSEISARRMERGLDEAI
jgi:hypothetical protein